MEQKWTRHKVKHKKAPGQTTHQKAGFNAGPSVQVEELESLQHSGADKIRLKTGS